MSIVPYTSTVTPNSYAGEFHITRAEVYESQPKRGLLATLVFWSFGGGYEPRPDIMMRFSRIMSHNHITYLVSHDNITLEGHIRSAMFMSFRHAFQQFVRNAKPRQGHDLGAAWHS